ncbi:uroporphyrinogen-III synthase [Zoogloea sp.]|uniref:uroporphyrinogen-III synthase n=1 Tax=Zoogloea sp. TaxID=49181 RepID=UPI002621B537|nr:uroporphyrinogen-III synthase [Zoogloea sp.]MDD3352149.1 uroporphyrinogen-III synthase [Zoogloea sp.]
MVKAPAGPLAGRVIAVTRPVAQADGLCATLAGLGAEPLRFPLLHIEPVADPEPLRAMARRLDEFSLAFFVSPNAVNLALDVILPEAPWPAHLVVATVGKGSEAALAARGFRQVLAPDRGFDSESALALPAFRSEAVAGRKVLILRGDGGRDLLGDTLKARGAWVEYLTCYHRGGPPEDPAPLLARVRQGALDALTLTSSEGVSHLLALPDAALLKDVPVFVPHARIAAVAREGGFARVILTEPGDTGLIAGLVGHFSVCDHDANTG